MEDKKELKDEELEKINGGLTGFVTGGANNIIYTRVDESGIEEGRFYADVEGELFVRYVNRIRSGRCEYSNYLINFNANRWITNHCGDEEKSISEFAQAYPYKLSITADY